MMLRQDLRTDAQICGKSASQASLFVHHGRGVNRVYGDMLSFVALNQPRLFWLNITEYFNAFKHQEFGENIY